MFIQHKRRQICLVRSFWNKQQESKPSDLIKYVKDPKMFAEYGKI